MILFIPVAFLAALALVVFFLLQSVKVALLGNEGWAGWRRVVVAAALACAATATASYSLGAIGLMSTVAVAQDGGADSAPFPYDHPCRSKLQGAVGYDVHFLSLRTVCVMEDGERRTVEDVPQGIRMTAAASVACTAVLAGIAWAARPRAAVTA
ncbi:hypothetical protein [Streptomyces sp. RKAG293]|uniref:hypothetical protein n=1 Tax=Streptomyces sp. RKAG293 TaxID=2893403 RepID=UPI002033AA32|nr:hypothetical protein [Streptomyces sp. RKAG293]MCM2416681.1 hypothetical protein [Streptomyces sp. RKAG293]